MPLEQQTVPDAQSEQHGEPTQEIEDTEDSAVVVNEEDEKTVQKFESKELEKHKSGHTVGKSGEIVEKDPNAPAPSATSTNGSGPESYQVEEETVDKTDEVVDEPIEEVTEDTSTVDKAEPQRPEEVPEAHVMEVVEDITPETVEEPTLASPVEEVQSPRVDTAPQAVSEPSDPLEKAAPSEPTEESKKIKPKPKPVTTKRQTPPAYTEKGKSKPKQASTTPLAKSAPKTASPVARSASRNSTSPTRKRSENMMEREYRNYKATLQDKEREMEAIRKTNDELRGKVNALTTQLSRAVRRRVDAEKTVKKEPPKTEANSAEVERLKKEVERREKVMASLENQRNTYRKVNIEMEKRLEQYESETALQDTLNKLALAEEEIAKQVEDIRTLKNGNSLKDVQIERLTGQTIDPRENREKIRQLTGDLRTAERQLKDQEKGRQVLEKSLGDFAAILNDSKTPTPEHLEVLKTETLRLQALLTSDPHVLDREDRLARAQKAKSPQKKRKEHRPESVVSPSPASQTVTPTEVTEDIDETVEEV